MRINCHNTSLTANITSQYSDMSVCQKNCKQYPVAELTRNSAPKCVLDKICHQLCQAYINTDAVQKRTLLH